MPLLCGSLINRLPLRTKACGRMVTYNVLFGEVVGTNKIDCRRNMTCVGQRGVFFWFYPGTSDVAPKQHAHVSSRKNGYYNHIYVAPATNEKRFCSEIVELLHSVVHG